MDATMKIGYICSDIDVQLFGHEGCSVHIREFTNALVEAGHDVFILCAWTGMEKLADGIETLLHSPALAADMGESARKRILSRFTWSAITNEVVAIARELLFQRSAATSRAQKEHAGAGR